jgi:hypothetical protein
MSEHNWSGWPGAYCLNCGAGDPAEDALAHGCDDCYCTYCGIHYPMLYDKCIVPEHNIVWTDCGEHPITECTPVHGHFAQEEDQGICLICLKPVNEQA